MYKYSLRYTWDVENIKEGYIKEDAGDKGLCDSLIGISIILPDDGGYSQCIFSYSGKESRELTQEEIFKAWLMLGLSLNNEGELKGWRKQTVKIVSDRVREIFKKNKI